MLARAAETLFTRLIDYAGLFPPAALPMADAVRNYAAYRAGEHAWMLGRFIVPAENVPAVPGDFPLSVLGTSDNDTLEVKAASGDDVARIAAEAKGRTIYVEVGNLDLIDDLAQHGLRAKIRTGGVTPSTVPPASFVANFIRRCAERGVPFKATAGLHHPVRCMKALTYDAGAPRGMMHGFINVFLAAALLPQAESILTEEDPRAFAFEDDSASWRGHAVRTEDLARLRSEFAISFGSCSFEEPVADLKELGWL
jgi:hypothetical protein